MFSFNILSSNCEPKQPLFFCVFFFFLNHFAAVFIAWYCSAGLARETTEDVTRHKGDKVLSHFNVQPRWNANSKQCMIKGKLNL